MHEPNYKEKLLQFVNLLITDMDGAAELMADGFIWENYLPDHVPFGGRYESVQGMREYFAQLGRNWEIGALNISEVIASEDGRSLAAIGVEQHGKALPTGKSCDMPFVWIFRLNDAGQFTSVREYNDTHAIGQAFLP